MALFKLLKNPNIHEIFYFLVGFLLGIPLCLLLNQGYQIYLGNDKMQPIAVPETAPKSLYNQSLANELLDEVKILCWVFTHPANHKTKVPHVLNTWSRKCNKLLFISTEIDPENPHLIALPVKDGRENLWTKTMLTMQHVYEHFINDYDWFMRADDDNFIVMENLRYMLYQFHPQTALHIGCRFAIHYPNTEEGFMAGGGQIFSRKALIKFNEISIKNPQCYNHTGDRDDVFVGTCLKDLAIFLDGRDKKNQKRFFPLGTEEHMKDKKLTKTDWWYPQYTWRNATQGSLDCCSDTFIEKHYAKPAEMYLLDYLIYHVHPFGLQKNLTEKLPQKLSLAEVIELSDEKSFASDYQVHERHHQIDDDERYE